MDKRIRSNQIDKNGVIAHLSMIGSFNHWKNSMICFCDKNTLIWNEKSDSKKGCFCADTSITFMTENFSRTNGVAISGALWDENSFYTSRILKLGCESPVPPLEVSRFIPHMIWSFCFTTQSHITYTLSLILHDVKQSVSSTSWRKIVRLVCLN